MDRLVVVGMTNPLSRDPRHALWTQPPGCTGHRLWQMATARTDIGESEWLAMTERLNLCTGKWDRRAAIARAGELWEHLRDRTVVVLGVQPWLAMRREGDLLTGPLEWLPDREWVNIPHPSGLCRWYNSGVCRAAVEILLGDLVEAHRASAMETA